MELITKRNQLLAPRLIKQLEKRQMAAYYCETAEEARQQALALIDKTDTISWGGSMTLNEIGLIDTLYQEGYQVIDRDKATTPEERFDLMRQALLCDTYLTSFNAIAEDGQLVNVDSVGNRTAAIAFGPKSVVAIISLNKLCKTVDEAVSRARNYAAPLNALRCASDPHLKGLAKTPCLNSGSCGDCKAEGCVCSQIVITRMSKVPQRLKVILVGADLGL